MMRMRLLITLIALASASLTGCSTAMFAGAGAGVSVTDDRRTPGTYVTDEGIELTTAKRFAERAPDAARAIFTCFNRRVLITGQVPDEAVKKLAGDLAKEHSDVRSVVNELAIGEAVSLVKRASDSYVTSKVKAHLIDDTRLSANHIKVVTENGTVYLMGLVKRDEGQVAAEVTARTSGVSRVVKVFEYQD
jgi:osmotically-inducible protein OsmY